MSDAIEAEVVVEEKGLAKKEDLSGLVKEQDRPLLGIMENAQLDWKSLKPNQMAVLLMQRPFAVSGGGTTYLNFRQALYFAVRCFELGVSPFSSAVWFDPQRFSVNLTLEGKREVARNKGIELGPPQFEEIGRKWEDVARMTENATAAKNAGFTKDVGIKCRIRVGDPKNNEHSEYIAYISEWYVSRSPVWKEKPMHMLQIRAQEKAISLAMGTGASAMPDEKELE
jgi:hypothetical protein